MPAPPADLLQARIELAAQVSADLLADSPQLRAIAVTGSTAHGRCLRGSDLDLLAIAETPPEEVTSFIRDGVRVDVEWLTPDQAKRHAGRGGWTWELRKSARLGTALPLHDPDSLFNKLLHLAQQARPDPARFASQLEAIERQLFTLHATGHHADAEALRAALDPLAMLVQMTNPRRYQKAKWLLDDLLDAGHPHLAGALIDAYGIGNIPLSQALANARACVAAALQAACEPDAAKLIAMGHAPDHAAASYVARTLADAEELAACRGYETAAHYTACFAARLATSLPGARTDATYRACFPGKTAPPRAFAAAITAAAECRHWLAEAKEAA